MSCCDTGNPLSALSLQERTEGGRVVTFVTTAGQSIQGSWQRYWELQSNCMFYNRLTALSYPWSFVLSVLEILLLQTPTLHLYLSHYWRFSLKVHIKILTVYLSCLLVLLLLSVSVSFSLFCLLCSSFLHSIFKSLFLSSFLFFLFFVFSLFSFSVSPSCCLKFCDFYSWLAGTWRIVDFGFLSGS